MSECKAKSEIGCVWMLWLLLMLYILAGVAQLADQIEKAKQELKADIRVLIQSRNAELEARDTEAEETGKP